MFSRNVLDRGGLPQPRGGGHSCGCRGQRGLGRNQRQQGKENLSPTEKRAMRQKDHVLIYFAQDYNFDTHHTLK